MQITVNGAAREFPEPVTVAELLDQMELSGKRVAVEVNGEIVPKSTHRTHLIHDEDRVEVVEAMGGG